MASAVPPSSYPATTSAPDTPMTSYNSQQRSMKYSTYQHLSSSTYQNPNASTNQPRVSPSPVQSGCLAPTHPSLPNYGLSDYLIPVGFAVSGSLHAPLSDHNHATRQMLPPTSSTPFLAPSEAPDGWTSKLMASSSNASGVIHHPGQVHYSPPTPPDDECMARWGYRNDQGSWGCSFPGCTSESTFQSERDLRKHYKRHTKTLFCRYVGCPQATEGGFGSKKDRARHEAKHNPQVHCEWPGCPRLFSRVDNMKDHIRRIHKKDRAKA